jgi:hypothetical protein
MLSLRICAVYCVKGFENEVNGCEVLISRIINARHFCNMVYDTLNALLTKGKMKKEANKKLYGNTTVFAKKRQSEKVMNYGIENL